MFYDMLTIQLNVRGNFFKRFSLTVLISFVLSNFRPRYNYHEIVYALTIGHRSPQQIFVIQGNFTLHAKHPYWERNTIYVLQHRQQQGTLRT